MPRVLVDLLFYTGTKGGMESYARRLYSAMPADAGLDFTALISREAADADLEWFPGDVVHSDISGENRAAWALGELRSVGRNATRLQADLIHAPANVGPARSHVPVALTVHDVLPFVRPEWVPGQHALALRWLVARAARAAARVITVSRASEADIVRELDVSPGRIDVIPLSGDGTGPVMPAPKTERPMVLSIGNRMPHKNGETLVRALATLSPDRRPLLTLTGGSEASDPLRRLARQLGVESDIDFVGWVSPERLETLFHRTSLVAVPTRFEGFGLPVLEAMSRGRAVVCSDIPVLREVAADAAVYLPPLDTTAWANTLAELPYNTPRLRALETAGLMRSALYSWTLTADRTLAAFQRALKAR